MIICGPWSTLARGLGRLFGPSIRRDGRVYKYCRIAARPRH